MIDRSLLDYFTTHHLPRGEVLNRLPLSISIEEFWPALQEFRKARAMQVPLSGLDGKELWFVMTDSIITSGDRISSMARRDIDSIEPGTDMMTDGLLEISQGRFIVGMTDWHPGGDGLAALRDPQTLAADMILHPEEVRQALLRLEEDYFAVYDVFYQKLRAAGQPITTWIPLVSEGRYYVPSNDFSIMISERMFNDMFLPGIARECQFYDRSIYHLDGPGAIRHLGSLLGICALDAVQWVPGAGNEGFARWVSLYQRIQAADKGIEVLCTFDDIPLVMETLDPRGLYLWVSDVPSREAGEHMLAALEAWTARRAS